jgi:hypothetical protein
MIMLTAVRISPEGLEKLRARKPTVPQTFTGHTSDLPCAVSMKA